MGVEKFEQQRELLDSCVTPKQFATPTAHEVAQAPTGQGAACDPALVVSAIDDFPTFGAGFFGRDLFAQRRLQPASAPQIMTPKRMES
jgi:hypothetical protein